MPEIIIQEPIRIPLRRLDDVFHRMIIALERLEIYLECERRQGAVNNTLSSTAIHTDRDLHDDVSNPPTRESFFGEVQLDCSALFFQTKFDDKEIFEKAVKYFLNDLLEWYGGRADSIPYNGVDAFILPIIMSLSRQVTSVSEILEVTDKYVEHIPRITEYNDEEKAIAIKVAIETLIQLMDNDKNKKEAYEVETVFSVHKRGSAIDGYKRIISAMLNLFDEAMPSILVYRTVQNYLPEIATEVPTISEDYLLNYIDNKNQQESKSSENGASIPKEEQSDKELVSDDKKEEPKESNDEKNDMCRETTTDETVDNSQSEPIADSSQNIIEKLVDKVKTILK